MSIRLLEGESAEKLRLAINSDAEFALVSRDMTLNLCLEVGAERRLIIFRDGKAQLIGRFAPLSETVDVAIKGAVDFWRHLLSPLPPQGYQNLYAGVRFKTCEVQGNSELYFAYFAAITRMIELMRDHQQDH